MIDANGLMARAASDPYPVYDLLRSTGRVQWIEDMRLWLVTGHPEVLAVLRHDRMSSDRTRWDAYQLPEGQDEPLGGMFAMDPPEHTRLRGLVQGAFGQRRIQGLRQSVEALVDRLLTAAGERAEIDLVADFAGPLPAIVFADLLGIPAEDHATFRTWTTGLSESIDPVSHVISATGLAIRATLREYLEQVIAERRARPRDDLISSLVAAEERGDRLSAAELVEMCVLLTVAGLETTTNLIANGMNALFEHPGQLERLRAEPELIEPAVEELLRYDAPIQLSGRVAMDDLVLAGQAVRAGAMVGVILGAANRDPEVFAAPNELDLTRDPNPHVAFGRGVHFCLGAPLARLEGQVAIRALVTCFPGIRPAGAARRRANIHVRGFASLPVMLRPA